DRIAASTSSRRRCSSRHRQPRNRSRRHSDRRRFRRRRWFGHRGSGRRGASAGRRVAARERKTKRAAHASNSQLPARIEKQARVKRNGGRVWFGSCLYLFALAQELVVHFGNPAKTRGAIGVS